MDDQVHVFTLFIAVGYSVADPRLLVTRRLDDPLKKLRDAAASVMQRAFAQIDWDRILDEFRDVERSVLASVDSTLAAFAGAYGLQVASITLAHHLRPEDNIVRLNREKERIARSAATLKKAEAEIDHDVKAHADRLRDIEVADEAQRAAEKLAIEADTTAALRKRQRHLEHDLQTLDDELSAKREEVELAAAAARRMASVADTIAATLNTAIRNAGDAIRDPDALLATVTKVHSKLAEIAELAMGKPRALPAAQTQFLLQENRNQNGAAAVIGGMLNQTANVAPLAVRRRLESAFLHLVGELVLDGDADKNVVKQYKERLSVTAANASLQPPQFEYFAKAATGDHLLDSLR